MSRALALLGLSPLLLFGCLSIEVPFAPDTVVTRLDAAPGRDGTVFLPPDVGAPDLLQTRLCKYTQKTVFIADSVDGSKPCGPGDGTCLSGVATFGQKNYTLEAGDAAEVYLFAKPETEPVLSYRRRAPKAAFAFKIPNIPKTITDACNLFQLGGRLDKGADNKGQGSGSEDIRLPRVRRLQFNLIAGQQLKELKLKFD